MTDSGAAIQFGTFITPRAADPQRTVSLAVQSERAGLDLVTFQDHPYQPAFLDTWTLLAFVAARTEKVTLAGNVHNLPLRPPAVLARSAASLDRLSGGRLALGLGAGGFPEAAAAMGAQARSRAQAVRAVSEAIPLIRDLWDTEPRGGVFRDGEFYRVIGAKRGPAPAHPIPIWVGGYKPRMLQLVGTLADGWLPSLSYLGGRDQIAAAAARVDDAARAAGREPSQIRRLINVPQDRANPELLTELALEHGFDTFILVTDDPGQIQRFADETAPECLSMIGR